MSRPFGRQHLVVVVAVGLLAVGRAAAQADLPVAELDPHFRGGKLGHAYTNAMLELGMRMGAATTAALRDDRERALAALKSFREQHARVAAMVPSWKAQFRGALLEELQAAVASKADLAARQKIVARIESSCTACHSKYLFPVQARYRWGDFANASVQTDAGETLTFHQLMLDIANGLGAVRGDVEAGKIPEAQAAYKQLLNRFGLMESLCTNCHEQERRYFIDAGVKGKLLKVGGLLRRGEARVAEYAPLFADVNKMSCLPCHQVHMPAAFQQAARREGER
jgi:hypothetical protein